MHQPIERTAVVTGGTRGIGRAIVSALANEGVTVLLTGTDPAAARAAAAQVVDEIAATGGRPAPLVYGTGCRVESEPSVDRLAEFAREHLGRIDVLVNNAAIARRAALEDITLDEWSTVVGTNLTGTFLVTRALVPLMSGPTPAIVNVSSQAAKVGGASLSHYAATKAGQIGFTKSLALELAPRIRVNAVCPGLVMTDMLHEQLALQSADRRTVDDDVARRTVNRVPLQRLQTPESVAAVVAFLVSDRAADLTGQALNVSGGMVME